MAKSELTVPYKVPLAKATFNIMLVLLPIWAIVIPAALGLFIGFIIGNPERIPVYLTILCCMALSATMITCIIISGVAEDNRIHISKDILSFPPFMLCSLKFKRNRRWEELLSATLIEDSQNKSPIILLAFEDGATLPLDTACLDVAEQEQLLLSVELWGSRCHMTPELIEYQRKHDTENGDSNTGYTKMWEEELGRRFQSTNFVPLEPDTTLKGGSLKVIKQLAFGGLSAIYLAHSQGRDTVVLKEAVIPQSSSEEQRTRAQELLRRESSILAGLNHPAIAKVMDHFVEDGRHYLVLEYINGQDLRQLIKQNGPVSFEKALEWGARILEILDYLHSQDPPVLHRDLTPDNIVLTREGELILIDFGAANHFLGAATGTVVGKQAYISPEQLRGKAELRSDFYSFAGTIYFLLCGEDPLALTPCDISVLHDQNNNLEDLAELLLECSAFEASDRPESASSISRRLASIAEKSGMALLVDSARKTQE